MLVVGLGAEVAVGVVHVEEGLGQQRVHVRVGGGVVDEGAFTPPSHETCQPQLGQVLAHGRGADPGQVGQTGHRRLALQQRPQQLDAGRVGEHAEGLGSQVCLLVLRHGQVGEPLVHEGKPT